MFSSIRDYLQQCYSTASEMLSVTFKKADGLTGYVASKTFALLNAKGTSSTQTKQIQPSSKKAEPREDAVRDLTLKNLGIEKGSVTTESDGKRTYTLQPREGLIARTVARVYSRVTKSRKHGLVPFVVEDPIERRFTNFTLKKPLSRPEDLLAKQKEEDLHKRYDATHIMPGLIEKRKYAESFQKEFQDTVDDPEGLDRIVRSREIMEEIACEDSSSAPVSLVLRVSSLNNPTSAKVVHLKNGGATFSIPGGYTGVKKEGHYVTYELKMEPDAINGGENYFFILHNRGDGLQSKNLHGDLSVTGSNGAKYSKTSVCIKVPKEALSEAFFEQLLNAGFWNAENMEPAHSCIEEHLLKKGGGVIQRSKEEICALELHEKLRSKAARLQADLAGGIEELRAIESKKEPLLEEKWKLKDAQETLHEPSQLEENKEYQSRIDEIDSALSTIAKLESEPKERLKKHVEELEGFLKTRKWIADSEKNLKVLYVWIDYAKNRGRVADFSSVLSQFRNYVLRDIRVSQEELRQNNILLIENDDSFNSQQTFGTCSESNRVGPEKQMASKTTRLMLKQYTIQALTEKVRQATHIPEQDQQYMLSLSAQRQAQLQAKIISAGPGV